jgi:Zinc carboxypeptidase
MKKASSSWLFCRLVKRTMRFVFFSCLLVGVGQAICASPTPMTLHAERTAFAQSGPYREVEQFCRDLQRGHPSAVKCFDMGKSAQGRDIKAMVVSKTGTLDAQRAAKKKIPVVLVIGGTHAGEIDGKDAGLMLMRDLLADPSKFNPLRQLVVLFVPVFNVDGHENRSKFSRPNQNGPVETGQRTNALRINLNRDWMIAQAEETKAMLRLVQLWDPLVTMDLHVTDGLRFRHDISVSMSSHHAIDPVMQKVGDQMLQRALAQLGHMGHSPLGFYPQLKDVNDPGMGVIAEADAPRFSHVYPSLRNRWGVLMEDHAWSPYAERVMTNKNALLAFFQVIAEMRLDLWRAATAADDQHPSMAGREVPMMWVNAVDIDPKQTAPLIELKGYRYEVFENAPVVGGRGIAYDTSQNQIWSVPFYNQLLPIQESTVKLPLGGYVVPREWVSVVKPILVHHGIRFEYITNDQKPHALEVMRVRPQDVVYDTESFQGKQRTSVSGVWTLEKRTLLKGSLFVPIRQPKASLVAHLFEPVAPDSMSSWGVFNTAYETSDYVADHRELELIQKMHAQSPEIRQLFGDELADQLPLIRQKYEEKLSTDESFRLDQQARIDHWMSYLPSQDPDLFLYPIFRSTSKPMKGQWTEPK